MRPLRYSINVTLNGCCDHRAILPDKDLHRHAVENLEWADAVRGALEANRLNAREPPGVQFGGSGDALRTEKISRLSERFNATCARHQPSDQSVACHAHTSCDRPSMNSEK
jgi:hypothetical protein